MFSISPSRIPQGYERLTLMSFREVCSTMTASLFVVMYVFNYVYFMVFCVI